VRSSATVRWRSVVSRQAIAAALARKDLAGGERLVAFSLPASPDVTRGRGRARRRLLRAPGWAAAAT
jgi:hypothetical protein